MGLVLADRVHASDWEAFLIIKIRGSAGVAIRDGDDVAFRSHDGRYLSAEWGGGRVLS